MSKVVRLDENQLIDLIENVVNKTIETQKKKSLIENQIKELQSELTLLESMEETDGDLEEGKLGKFFGTDKSGLMMDKANGYLEKGWKLDPKHSSVEDLVAAAKADKFNGKLLADNRKGTIYYVPEKDSYITKGSATGQGRVGGTAG